MRDHDLSRYVVPISAGAEFRAERDCGLVRLTPLTPEALAWLKKMVEPGSSWFDGSLMVEGRYVEELFDGIIAAGLLFESGSMPN